MARCTSVAVPQSQQVSNPVAFMPTDNNGVVVSLPALEAAGAGSAFGYLVLGIDTESNNSSQGKSVLSTNSLGNISTTVAGHTYYASFIDSGSNGLFFPSAGTVLAVGSDGFYDPSMIAPLSAALSDGSHSLNGIFRFLAPITLSTRTIQTSRSTMSERPPPQTSIGDCRSFYGKSVYVGIEGTTSMAGTGPYWAY